jgi:hypothetical protein
VDQRSGSCGHWPSSVTARETLTTLSQNDMVLSSKAQ